MSRAAQISLMAALGVLLAGLVALGVALLTLRPPVAETQPSALGGPFRLVDQDNRPVTDAAFQGRPTLLFFGFTHCPDVCPAKLFEIARVAQALGPLADRLNVVLVSVDPERDTPELLKSYLESFDPRFRGFTGSVEEIQAVARAWRAYYRKVPLEGGSYTVDHTTAVYLLDARGRFVSTLDVADAERAAALLRPRL